MQLDSLNLVNFKNFNQLEISSLQKINCFVGKNGEGKTNLLDSIYYLSFTKSYFNLIDFENIKYSEDFFVIQGKYITNSNDNLDIYCGVKHGHKKKFNKNKKTYKKLSEHIGLIPLVIITPSDIDLIIGGSAVRRKFIDSVISQFDKEYLESLLKYNKILENRNKLLKHFNKSNFVDKDSLAVWDEQLINHGNLIFAKRKDFINNLIPVFQKYYSHISSDNEKVELRYNSQLAKNNFADLLVKSFEKDIILQHTSVGIHKDDLSLELENHQIKKIGSQGQKKTYFLSLKLAQFEFIKNICGFKPLLLFDDVFDKLDSERVSKLIELVSDNNFGQIFITDTSKTRLENILSKINISSKIYKIKNGLII